MFEQVVDSKRGEAHWQKFNFGINNHQLSSDKDLSFY